VHPPPVLPNVPAGNPEPHALGSPWPALGATAIAAAPTAVMASTYVVRPGDTLTGIALRHGSSVQAIVDANQLGAPGPLRVGQLLEIPDPSRSLPSYVAGSQDLDTCTVTAGDTLWIISRRYGVDPTALARANGLNVNAQLPAALRSRSPAAWSGSTPCSATSPSRPRWSRDW